MYVAVKIIKDQTFIFYLLLLQLVLCHVAYIIHSADYIFGLNNIYFVSSTWVYIQCHVRQDLTLSIKLLSKSFPVKDIAQIIFLFRSFEISNDIQRVQNNHV